MKSYILSKNVQYLLWPVAAAAVNPVRPCNAEKSAVACGWLAVDDMIGACPATAAEEVVEMLLERVVAALGTPVVGTPAPN